MVRRSTRVKTAPTKYGDDITDAPDETVTQPNHRKADQPKGVLSKKTKSQPTSLQTLTQGEAVQAVRLMPKEFEALVGMRRLALGIDAHASRQQELARLEVEDPVGHYYAQTVAERAPYQLQAASVLFQMSGGDVAEPVAALTAMKLRREKGEREKRVAMAKLLGAWRTAKAKKEGGEVVEMSAEEPKKGGRKRKLPVGETGGGEPPKKKKSVRFGGEE